MSLDLKEIKDMHDRAFSNGQDTRREAADDIVFSMICGAQWDNALRNTTELRYKGEFDLLLKSYKDVVETLEGNPVQIDFQPLNETRDDAAEVLDGLYRRDLKKNTSQAALENAKHECVICGYGAWRLYADYESSRTNSMLQIVRREPIFEANNTVMWDSNSKHLDKSDAKYVSVLSSYTYQGYKNLVKQLTGETKDKVFPSNFSSPEISYAFPWINNGGEEYVYITTFYYREKIKEKLFVLNNFLQQKLFVSEKELNEISNALLSEGYEIIGEKEKELWKVTQYIASGEEILSQEVIAGEHIPIVPMYGLYGYVENQPVWEGIVRRAKDAQRLRNFNMSYLADIVSRSPRQKPIFTPEQIQGYEHMFQDNGADNAYPYLLQNLTDQNGEPIPLGSVGELPEQKVPTALLDLIILSKDAVSDIINPGIPQDIADPELSGKAVLAFQRKFDQQSMLYQRHYKHALKRDAEVYSSMVSEIFSEPRRVLIDLPDGTSKEVITMQTELAETGESVVANNLSNAEFEVFSKISPDYDSQREKTLENIEKMVTILAPEDPLRELLILKGLELTDGVSFDEIREYATNQLILKGIKKPETPEQEQMLLQQAQSQQQPDAAMVMAQAEQLKGQADILEEQRKGIEMQLKNANELSKLDIDKFKAITERYLAEVEAAKKEAEVGKLSVDTIGGQFDNFQKVQDLTEPVRQSEKVFSQRY